MRKFHRLAHAQSLARLFGAVAHVMVEDNHSRRAGLLLHQTLDLGVINPAHLVGVIEVAHRRIVMRQHEALVVKGDFIGHRPPIDDADGLFDDFSSPWRHARWRLVGV